MKQGTDCERVRMQLMVALDGETNPRAAANPQHLSTCASCRQWLQDLQSMTGQLHTLSYQSAGVDLWTAVEGRIRQPDSRLSLTARLLAIGALVLAWRALQLLIDLPIPLLHPIVPIAAAVAAAWQVGDPLEIATFAPELQKRGI